MNRIHSVHTRLARSHKELLKHTTIATQATTNPRPKRQQLHRRLMPLWHPSYCVATPSWLTHFLLSTNVAYLTPRLSLSDEDMPPPPNNWLLNLTVFHYLRMQTRCTQSPAKLCVTYRLHYPKTTQDRHPTETETTARNIAPRLSETKT